MYLVLISFYKLECFLRLYEFVIILKIGLHSLCTYINNGKRDRLCMGNGHIQTLKTDVDMFKITNKTIKTWSNGYLVVCDFHLTYTLAWIGSHLPSGFIWISVCVHGGTDTIFTPFTVIKLPETPLRPAKYLMVVKAIAIKKSLRFHAQNNFIYLLRLGF